MHDSGGHKNEPLGLPAARSTVIWQPKCHHICLKAMFPPGHFMSMTEGEDTEVSLFPWVTELSQQKTLAQGLSLGLAETCIEACCCLRFCLPNLHHSLSPFPRIRTVPLQSEGFPNQLLLLSPFVFCRCCPIISCTLNLNST